MDSTYNDQDRTADPASGRRVRVVRPPMFTAGDVAAYIAVLAMVGGPLAFGAFGL